MFPRRHLEAGQTEFLEVTYAPTISGQTTGALEIKTSSGQTYTVDLGGTALRIRRDVDVDIIAQPTDNVAAQQKRPGTQTLR